MSTAYPLGAESEASESALPISEGATCDEAALADAFSLSLHAVLEVPAADGDRALVYGCGRLGLFTIAILTPTDPQAESVAAAHHGFKADPAREVLRPGSTDEVIDAVARLSGKRLITPRHGPP